MNKGQWECLLPSLLSPATAVSALCISALISDLFYSLIRRFEINQQHLVIFLSLLFSHRELCLVPRVWVEGRLHGHSVLHCCTKSSVWCRTAARLPPPLQTHLQGNSHTGWETNLWLDETEMRNLHWGKVTSVGEYSRFNFSHCAVADGWSGLSCFFSPHLFLTLTNLSQAKRQSWLTLLYSVHKQGPVRRQCESTSISISLVAGCDGHFPRGLANVWGKGRSLLEIKWSMEGEKGQMGSKYDLDQTNFDWSSSCARQKCGYNLSVFGICNFCISEMNMGH